MLDGLARIAAIADERGVGLSMHTHTNHAASVTPLVAEAARSVRRAGLRDVRNQGVLMKGVNASAEALLDLCFALHGEAGIVPYYFYLCDMIPHAEHWRTSVHEAQRLQEAIMGYLPGYATPRIVCDVPYVGKRWVHQSVEYDRERGISYWTKSYQTVVELDSFALEREEPVLRPDSPAPQAGEFWRERVDATVAS